MASTTGTAQGELVLQRAGKKSERASARHIGPGEYDLGDLAVAIEVGGVSGGDPGLAGARRAEHHHLRARPERVEIVGLRRVERRDRRRQPLAFKLRPMKRDDLRHPGRTRVTLPLLASMLTQGPAP